jgi:GR25 family glycosyltransferase involved in LPS biosynthesis
MNSIKDIKNIFYINLDNRPDRKAKFEKEISKLGIQATRFNAIKYKHGAIGCTMSHLYLLKYAKNKNLDHILIMEDDITFLNPSVFINSINNILSNNINFDVLLIAGNNMGKYTKINNFCVKITKCQTTTGYLVKSHYYDKLIQNIEYGLIVLMNSYKKRSYAYAIDQYWNKLQQIDNWLLVTPLTVSQSPDYSNIENRVINYNNVMLQLDKQMNEPNILSNTMNNIIQQKH